MTFFKKIWTKQEPKGILGSLGLANWWIETFNEKERDYIVTRYQPLGGDGKDLIKGNLGEFSGEISSFLGTLAGYFKNENDRLIAYRMIEKGTEHSLKLDNILDLHFFYGNEIEIYYRFRDIDDFALDKAMEACKKQISISKETKKAWLKEDPNFQLPKHKGYEQLIIALTKKGIIKEAVELAKNAKGEGWNGDWDNKIERLQKKLEKLS